MFSKIVGNLFLKHEPITYVNIFKYFWTEPNERVDERKRYLNVNRFIYSSAQRFGGYKLILFSFMVGNVYRLCMRLYLLTKYILQPTNQNKLKKLFNFTA